MKLLKNSLDKAIDHLAGKDSTVVPALLATLDKLVSSLRPSVIKTVAPCLREDSSMADAYLVEVTTPSGERRREIYHTQSAADQAMAMYARSAEQWQTQVFPLFKLPGARDSVPQGGSNHE